MLGGWRSADGELHDYYFLWVNGIAIHYGLVPRPQANSIMDKLMAKDWKKVGYDKFNMGLPGNLIPVVLKDYVHKALNVGGGVLPDNSDGFQNYENGGATGCFVFFTLAALCDLAARQRQIRFYLPCSANMIVAALKAAAPKADRMIGVDGMELRWVMKAFSPITITRSWLSHCANRKPDGTRDFDPRQI